jgi:hypothetical protein
MQIDGAVADSAAARLGYAGEATTRHQGTQHQRRSPHGLDDLVFGRGVRKNAATDRGAVLCTAVAEFHLGPHRSQQFPLRLNVANLGDILQHHFVFGENRRSHTGQGGVFGSAHPNRS